MDDAFAEADAELSVEAHGYHAILANRLGRSDEAVEHATAAVELAIATDDPRAAFYHATICALSRAPRRPRHRPGARRTCRCPRIPTWQSLPTRTGRERARARPEFRRPRTSDSAPRSRVVPGRRHRQRSTTPPSAPPRWPDSPPNAAISSAPSISTQICSLAPQRSIIHCLPCSTARASRLHLPTQVTCRLPPPFSPH